MRIIYGRARNGRNLQEMVFSESHDILLDLESELE